MRYREFCRALARWDPNGVAPNPFALKHRDIQAVTPPESELLSGFDNALCYRTLIAANDGFQGIAHNALAYLAREADPPSPAGPPSPPAPP